MIKELEKFPTVDEIKEKYPEPITANENSLRVDEWKDGLPEDKKTYTYIGDDINDAVETEEQYPHCNYCVGGAVQMAFGQMEPSFVDDWELGIFPRVMELAETLHYFCDIPYASKNDDAESFEEFVFDMDENFMSTNDMSLGEMYWLKKIHFLNFIRFKWRIKS